MLDLLILTLATVWLWASARYFFEVFIPDWFYLSRFLHPLAVLAFPLYLLWPDWITAMGVAGAVGIIVILLDRVVDAAAPPAPIEIPRRTRGQLPPLP